MIFEPLAVSRRLFPLAAVLLLGALLPWPYAYYQGLRLFVVAVCAYGVVLGYLTQQVSWAFTFALVAVPFIILHADRATWAILDVTAAAIIAIGGRALTRSKPTP